MASQGLARRPLKSRNTRWATRCTQVLIRLHVRPNHISIFSVVFAAGAGACFLLLNRFDGAAQIALYLTAGMCIQLRLLCNLLDGMVAIEGGFRSASGDVFNELPDRISDVVVLVPIGYALPNLPWAREIAWSAALLAVLTSYVRALGASLNMPQDFSGPMAKPQRMFVITAGCLLSCVEVLGHRRGNVMSLALVIVAIGSLTTVVRRTLRLIRWLESK
jgi:phosphatidylglycerophosphate synthase